MDTRTLLAISKALPGLTFGLTLFGCALWDWWKQR